MPLLYMHLMHLISIRYSVWAIMASPMLHGADLRTVQTEHPDCYKLITNADIIKVNQDAAALPVRMVYQHPPFPKATTAEIVEQIFARPLSGGRTAVLLLNRGPKPLQMKVCVCGMHFLIKKYNQKKK